MENRTTHWGRRLPLALVTLALLAAGLSGCGPTQADKLAEFLLQQRSPVSGVEYRVLPPDVISVRSQKVPEINGVSQQIRPDGMINLPLLGEVYVAGNTPGEIEEVLKQAALQYYTEVDATVNVSAYRSQQIYVFGQVGRSGPQAWTGTNTLLDVLAVSQPTPLAWPERIRVIRGRAPRRGGYVPGKDTTDAEATEEEATSGDLGKDYYRRWAQGQEQRQDRAKVLIVNMNDMIKSGDMSHNILLQPDDVVFVEANPLAKVGLSIQQLLFPVRPAIETVGLPSSAASAAAIP
jgi:protein involved in polysaccharide export with SLBB domain